MTDSENRSRPRYEAPTIIALKGLDQGLGYCAAGTNASDDYCTAGSAALTACTAGTSALTAACTDAGVSAGAACSAGDSAQFACTAGGNQS